MHAPLALSLSRIAWIYARALAALIGLAPLMISNNTGPVHVAAALGTPVVALYALTNPQHTPWQVPSRVLFNDVPCKFCYKSICPLGHHNCLRLVEPEDVVHAAAELLAAADSPATAELPAEVGCGSRQLQESRRRRRRMNWSAGQVDVLIPTFNRPAALAVTLTSLCAPDLHRFSAWSSPTRRRMAPTSPMKAK